MLHSTSDAALFARLLRFPEEAGDWLAGRCAAQLRRRPGGGGFSLLEHLCHLRDLERDGFVLRIRRIFDEDMPELQEIDGSTLAIERNYQSQDPQLAWRDWRAARELTVALLREALPQHAQRTGIYGGFGVVTLEGLAQGIATHDESHRQEMRALLDAMKD
ncbi:MAG TPA: DinB family protein [Albitalea sp.]